MDRQKHLNECVYKGRFVIPDRIMLIVSGFYNYITSNNEIIEQGYCLHILRDTIHVLYIMI